MTETGPDIGTMPTPASTTKIPARKNGIPNQVVQPPPSRICRRPGATSLAPDVLSTPIVLSAVVVSAFRRTVPSCSVRL